MSRLIVCLLFLTIFQLPGTLAAQSNRPNIVLVMADDQGWGETGYNGHPSLRTPHLDQLAESGVRFNRFYAGSAVCSPTRAAVLTGRSPLRCGVPSHGHALRLEEQTLAQALASVGYVTGHFGKWHLNGLRGPGVPILSSDPRGPGAFGFQNWLSVTNFFDRDPVLSRMGEFNEFTGDSSEIIVAEALKFIADAKLREQPALSVVWYGSPHLPFVASDEDSRQFANLDRASQQHYGELVALDRSVGNLLDGLDRLGLREDTLVWYCSDNGGLPKIQHGTVGKLRGHKGSLYEGGLRVPAILSWPARFEPAVSDYPAAVMDIFPTLVDLLELPAGSIRRPYDGRSLVAAIDSGGRLRDKPIPFSYKDNIAIVDNDWKLFKFTDQQDRIHWELYDLGADPRERNNLYSASVVQRMDVMKSLRQFESSLATSVAGDDYPDFDAAAEPKPKFWTAEAAYQPYFDAWRDRPEYQSRLGSQAK